MALAKERRGEVADKLLRYYIRQKGIPTLKANDLRRELGNIAKETGVPLQDLVEYYREVVWAFLEEALTSES